MLFDKTPNTASSATIVMFIAVPIANARPKSLGHALPRGYGRVARHDPRNRDARHVRWNLMMLFEKGRCHDATRGSVIAF
jgi:hypothetical protein